MYVKATTYAASHKEKPLKFKSQYPDNIRNCSYSIPVTGK